jgi:hypothetical protein
VTVVVWALFAAIYLSTGVSTAVAWALWSDEDDELSLARMLPLMVVLWWPLCWAFVPFWYLAEGITAVSRATGCLIERWAGALRRWWRMSK